MIKKSYFERALAYLDLDLDLDMYVVGPLGINTTEERARGNLVPLVDGCTETANCLCMHDTLVQVIPVNYGIRGK